MRKVPAGMKTCGIPSTGEVRWLDAVGVAGTAVAGTGVTVGTRVASDVAEGSTTAVAARRTAEGVDSIAGTCFPAQLARRKKRRRVGMSFFMDFPHDVKWFAA